MKINYHSPGDARRPRQLFVLNNEFSFAAFPVRPRHLASARTPLRAKRGRAFGLARKGAHPC